MIVVSFPTLEAAVLPMAIVAVSPESLRMPRFVDSETPVAIGRLARRDGLACWLCGSAIDPAWAGRTGDPRGPSLDHVVPLSAGGETAWTNLRLAHALCNSVRGSLPADEFAPPAPGRLAGTPPPAHGCNAWRVAVVVLMMADPDWDPYGVSAGKGRTLGRRIEAALGIEWDAREWAPPPGSPLALFAAHPDLRGERRGQLAYPGRHAAAAAA